MGLIAGDVDIARTLECLSVLQARGQLPGSTPAPGSIGTTELADGGVTNAKLGTGLARSKFAAGAAFAWVINGAGGLFSEVSPTLGRVICTDGNGLPVGSTVTQAQLEAALAGYVPTVTVSGLTTVNVALPTAYEQSQIDFRFVPSQDDVMFDLLVSTDGVTYDNSNAQYAYIGHINNGTNTTTGYDTPNSDRLRLLYDNAAANAGVGNLSTEGVWGRVIIRDRGVVSPARWPTIEWDLSYRNALSQQRMQWGSGFRQNGQRITHIRFQFENAGAFSGAYSVSPLAA